MQHYRPLADVRPLWSNVRLRGNSGHHELTTSCLLVTPDRLLDHLVSAQQERFGDRQAERLGGLEVDDEVKLGRILHGEISDLCALEDAIGIPCPFAGTGRSDRTRKKSEAGDITSGPRDVG